MIEIMGRDLQMKREVRIKDWAFANYKGTKVVVGKLDEDHHKFSSSFFSDFGKAGHRIISSPIVNITQGSVETQNTNYILIGEQSKTILSDIEKERGIKFENC